jgi:predicted enzyme related to lactoylglutathione lyase
MSDYQGHFVWNELMTTDLEAATTFYKSVVGWDTEDKQMPGMVYRLVSKNGGQSGGMMVLPKEACDMGVPPNWAPYIATNDVDADTARAESLGGRVYKSPMDIPGVGRFAVVGDPTGAAFSLFKPGMPPAGAPATGEGSVGWYELHSKDWQKAWPFYEGLFGWKKSTAMDMGPMGSYQIFSIVGQDKGAMFNSPAAAQHHSFWLTYFIVGDIDAAATRVTEGGGKITNGPMQVPGEGWILQAADPQGAMFALVGTRKS